MKLSLVLPTYNEKENLRRVVGAIQKEFKANKIEGEIILVDDNSPDGTGDIADDLQKEQKNIKVIHRKGKLGLSSAVLSGWEIATGDILGVMDADLSHPTDKIGELFFSIANGEADFSIGSRYVRGGKIEGWGFKRKIMSKTATLLSKVYTKVKDPMSGFFMIRKECVIGVVLNPKGFKILLEVIVKGNYHKIKEIPITFINRIEGKSKAGMGEIFYYLGNLLGYLRYTRETIKQFVKFAIVGGIGTIINIIILFLLTEKFGVYYLVSAIFAFGVAMTINFILNKLWTFGERMKINLGRKYLQFSLVSIAALGVNLLFLYLFTEIWGIYYLISQVFAIGISLIINFFGNKLWTFSR